MLIREERHQGLGMESTGLVDMGGARKQKCSGEERKLWEEAFGNWCDLLSYDHCSVLVTYFGSVNQICSYFYSS